MNRQRVKTILPEIENIIIMGKNITDLNSRVRLEQYLENNFDHEDIALIMAVMYIGRDEYISKDKYENVSDYYIEVENFYQVFNSDKAIKGLINHLFNQRIYKWEMIGQMLSKNPFAQYLEQGLHVLMVKRILK